MKASKMLIATLKEAPSEAQIDSHILLLRAGMVRTLVAGVYNYLPLGLKVLNNIKDIIREEMDAAGAQEILSSAMQPKELWVESGRWSQYGPELMRFKDRHEREFCLGPTHEEIFTDLARNLIKSPKNLPMNLYQIQTKYRDEMRPRFGLIRGREFLMKDAYTFDKDEAGLDKSYNIMYETYKRIFDRLGINYQIVLADSGAIGGSGSHQFMALSDIGESDIVYCDKCGYAADVETAEAVADNTRSQAEEKEISYISTPNVSTIDDLANFLNCQAKDLVKSVVYYDDDLQKTFLVLVRGDREVNDIKVINAIGTSEVYLRMATEKEIEDMGSKKGFIGPQGLNAEILIDREVANMKNLTVGANERDKHAINVNLGRDFKAKVFDLRKAVAGDKCPVCNEPLKIDRGIEVGQVFKLQTKYSEKMNCTYTNEAGKSVPMYMGCYGIGVSRTLQAIVEQNHDARGIKWPLNIAPYKVVIIPINYNNEEQKELADKAYESLSNQDVILDDRKAKAGYKFADWDLMGIPYQIICGRNSQDEIVELKNRMTDEKAEMSLDKALGIIKKALENIK